MVTGENLTGGVPDGELLIPFLGTDYRRIFERKGCKVRWSVPIRNEGRWVR